MLFNLFKTSYCLIARHGKMSIDTKNISLSIARGLATSRPSNLEAFGFHSHFERYTGVRTLEVRLLRDLVDLKRVLSANQHIQGIGQSIDSTFLMADSGYAPSGDESLCHLNFAQLRLMAPWVAVGDRSSIPRGFKRRTFCFLAPGVISDTRYNGSAARRF